MKLFIKIFQTLPNSNYATSMSIVEKMSKLTIQFVDCTMIFQEKGDRKVSQERVAYMVLPSSLKHKASHLGLH